MHIVTVDINIVFGTVAGADGLAGEFIPLADRQEMRAVLDRGIEFP